MSWCSPYVCLSSLWSPVDNPFLNFLCIRSDQTLYTYSLGMDPAWDCFGGHKVKISARRVYNAGLVRCYCCIFVAYMYIIHKNQYSNIFMYLCKYVV